MRLYPRRSTTETHEENGDAVIFRTHIDKVKTFAESERGSHRLKAARTVFVGGVVVWLAYQLAGIGWADVWAARPRTPWFYVLWAALYFQLPFIEAAIYRSVWGLPARESLSPLFRKRALNQDVVSYSGEAYFFAWARRRLSYSDSYIGGTLKDNAIASSLGSWAAAGLLIGGLLLSGHLAFADLLHASDPLYVAGGTVLIVLFAGLAVFFRQTLFTLSPRAVGGLFAAHLGRFLVLNYVLRILQWHVVLPGTVIGVWATMLAVTTLINRLPLIPAKDLVGIGAVLGMSHLLSGSEAAIAAMLLMHSVLKKAANFVFFVVLYFIGGDDPESLDEEQLDARPVDSTSTSRHEAETTP